jgi:hypothetical protein
MEKRRPRQRQQRLTVVPPPPSDWTTVAIELDAATIARLDALTARVRAGDVPASFARLLRKEPPRPRRHTVLKLALALPVLLFVAACGGTYDGEDLFTDDSAPLQSARDAGTDAAPAEVPDAGTPAADDKDAACFPLAWIDGVDPHDFTCQGTVMICPDGAPMIDACYGAIPWGGNVSIYHYRPTCCPAQ